jgi:hypothetical protein
MGLDRDESILYRMFLHKDAKMSKLGYPTSREDPYHVHKTLGLLSVCSFFYRYGYVYWNTGTLGFEGTPFDWGTMVIHTLLAFSSIIFRVPIKRINEKPMVIYEEYRQHAMVFTARCFSVYACNELYKDLQMSSQDLVVPLVVAMHHYTADVITAKHGNGTTAVRVNAAQLDAPWKKNLAMLYSLYQFLAIASHILPNARLGDLAYNAIIAIASSAFLMTLYRKRIIRGRTHMVVYSYCLVLSAFHIVRMIGMYATGVTLLTFAIRINLPRSMSNKYFVWTIFLCFMQYEHLPSMNTAVTSLKDNVTTIAGICGIDASNWTPV